MANYGLDLTDGLSQLLVIITQFFWGGGCLSVRVVFSKILDTKLFRGSDCVLAGHFCWEQSFGQSVFGFLQMQH